jgi:hypothetical protein
MAEAAKAKDPYSELQIKLNDITQRFAHETRYCHHWSRAFLLPLDLLDTGADTRGANTDMCKSARRWHLGQAK